MGAIITNIQRMCFHDGPGIRTTVFLQGCGIHCPWCANPENISFQRNAQYGREYEADELVSTLIKDQKFWGNDGGVTFSGGEPLLQASELLSVWEQLKGRGIHMVMETSLFASQWNLKAAMEYVDYFYVDIKLLDPQMCSEILGGNIEIYQANMKLLAEANKQVHFRIPCSQEYVLQPQNLEKIYDFLAQYPHYPVQIFAIHNLGDGKYRSLGMEPKQFKSVTEERLLEVKSVIEDMKISAEVIRI